MDTGSDKYIKRFDEWNNFKKILESISIDLPFFDREIWSIAIGVNLDIEIDGKGQNFERPVVIIKSFNSKHALIVSLTSITNVKVNVHIPIHNKDLDFNSVAIVTQLQRVSNRRFLKRVGVLNLDDFRLVVKAIRNILPSV
jgi:mRNA-degrading endonuclease toxin of MazEF toxin-antitoxin module